jgi:hypothetical protein
MTLSNIINNNHGYLVITGIIKKVLIILCLLDINKHNCNNNTLYITTFVIFGIMLADLLFVKLTILFQKNISKYSLYHNIWWIGFNIFIYLMYNDFVTNSCNNFKHTILILALINFIEIMLSYPWHYYTSTYHTNYGELNNV